MSTEKRDGNLSVLDNTHVLIVIGKNKILEKRMCDLSEVEDYTVRAMLTQEFKTEERCLLAKKEIEKELGKAVSVFCFKK